MDLSTKYNINDEVWFLHPQSQKVVQGRIKDIKLTDSGNRVAEHIEKIKEIL